MYYRARDKNGDYELWALDSPTSTPRRASGASPYARDRSPAHLHVHDGVLYMAAYGGPDVGNELFRFDPASHSLVLAADVAAGGEFGNPQGLVSYGGHLFFTARTVAEGFGLYGYDASSNTLTRHAQAADASARGVPLQNLTAHGGRLYFSPLDREGAGELLAFDLATGETAEPIPDGFSYCGGSPSSFGDALVLRVSSPSMNCMLSALDADGTIRRLFDESTLDAQWSQRIVFDGDLYLAATGPTVGTELYLIPGSVVDAIAPPSGVERRFRLSPNPARTSAHLALTLPAPERVAITLHDAIGRMIRLVHDGSPIATGAFSIDTSTLPSGLYFVRVAGESFTRTQPLTVVR